MRTLAHELAPHRIRVNTVHPTAVRHADDHERGRPTSCSCPSEEHPTLEQAEAMSTLINALPIPWVEPRRHQQRRAVPGLRRGALRHRRDAAGRRRHAVAVTTRAPTPRADRRADRRPRARARPGARGGRRRPRHRCSRARRARARPRCCRRSPPSGASRCVFVEGNAELTPGAAGRPPQPGPGAARGLQRGQLRAGPLVEAMREGGFLYIEEFNRAPEDTLNTLLTAMADREIAVPRVGHDRRPRRRSGWSPR